MPDTITRKHTLATPVTAYDQQVTEVTLRLPTPMELRQCGQPYLIINGGIKADYEACAQLLMKVCDPPLPGPAIDTLHPADFDEMAMILVGFTRLNRRGAAANISQPTA
jgi:hypothetical protein